MKQNNSKQAINRAKQTTKNKQTAKTTRINFKSLNS